MHENASKIWDILRANGLTEAGAAGVLGNMEAESGLVPCRLQGDFSTNYARSAAYAAEVDSGAMSRAKFGADTTGGGGWGLCQWTFPDRKLGLYDFCKSRGASIGDLTAQVLFFCKECRRDFAAVWAVLTTTASVEEASDVVLLKFERPAGADKQSGRRECRSLVYYNALAGREAGEANTSDTKEVEDVKTCTVKLRQLTKGSKGAQVKAAQTLLAGHGCKCGAAGVDGDFGSATESAARTFQEKRGLTADAIIGPATWKALLGAE